LGRVFSDSQAALAAITHYRREFRTRARLRMAGRPILSLICRVIGEKERVGSSVSMEWVRAHTDSQSLVSVGNRIADFVAQHYTTGKSPRRRIDHRVEPLPLMNEECWIALKCDDKLVTDDPRSCCRRQLDIQTGCGWRASSTQSLFSVLPDECRTLWDHVKLLMPECSGFTLRLLTDTLSWHWHDNTVVQRRCQWCPVDGVSGCSVVMDTSHLVECTGQGVRLARARGSSRFRSRLRASSAELDLHLSDDRKWAGDALRPILVSIGFLSATSRATNIGPMIGLFNDTCALAALRRYHVPAAARVLLLPDLRSCLLDWAVAAWKVVVDHPGDHPNPPRP